MTTVTVALKRGTRNNLPVIAAGDTWDCVFNTGPDGDQPSKVDAFTQGPNLGMTAVLTKEDGTVIESVTEPTATARVQWNPKGKPPQVGKNENMHYKVTVEVGGGAQSDLTIGRG